MKQKNMREKAVSPVTLVGCLSPAPFCTPSHNVTLSLGYKRLATGKHHQFTMDHPGHC